MKCKVRMTHTIEFFIEGKSEDEIQEWMNSMTPEEVVELTDGYLDESYTDEIICPIMDNSHVDYVIED